MFRFSAHIYPGAYIKVPVEHLAKSIFWEGLIAINLEHVVIIAPNGQPTYPISGIV